MRASIQTWRSSTRRKGFDGSHVLGGGHPHEPEGLGEDGLCCLDQFEPGLCQCLVVGDDPGLLVEAVERGCQVLGEVGQVMGFEVFRREFY